MPDAGAMATRLCRAVGQGHAAMVSLLLQHGAKKHQQNVDGLTPMQLADTKTRSVVDAMSAETAARSALPDAGGHGRASSTSMALVTLRFVPAASRRRPGGLCNYKPRPMEC